MQSYCENCGKSIREQELNECNCKFEGNWYEYICDDCWEIFFDEKVVK